MQRYVLLRYHKIWGPKGLLLLNNTYITLTFIIHLLINMLNVKTQKIFIWSLTVAVAGFLFGFDTVVISGSEETLQKLWGLDSFMHGVLVLSSALWGTVLGAIFGGIPTEKYGRRNTLFVIGILYFISAIGSGLASGAWMFAIYRFIGGLGVGASTIAAPAYISEISPTAQRGRLVALYQFNIVFGILIAYLSNYLLRNFGSEPWRWMIGAEALPAIMYLVLVLLVPESPRWLIIKRNAIDKAAPILAIIDADTPLSQQIETIKSENILPSQGTKESIWQKKYRKSLFLAFFVSFFNQFSGINAFLYLSNRIFGLAGLEDSAQFLGSIGLGLTNLIFTLLGVLWIDRLGRKQLMYIGSIGYIISLSLVSIAFYQNWTGIAVPIFLFLFIAAHAIGQGAIIWVFISEIFPNHLRSAGAAFGTSVHWILAAIIPGSTPWLMDTIGPGSVFAIFAAMMVAQLYWTQVYMPETKGISLETMQKMLKMI
jgi:sugar porter (SP) family MFS transporter